MPTIDQLDLAIYLQYAKQTQFVEAVYEEYHLKEAALIPAETRVVDIYPRVTEMQLLLGVAATLTPWAYFLPPRKFGFQRQSPFAFHRVVPSLGSAEKREADMAKLSAVECACEEEKEEKAVVKKCLERVENLNNLLNFIVGRIGQFLQG